VEDLKKSSIWEAEVQAREEIEKFFLLKRIDQRVNQTRNKD
jgi:hypothetical protein